MMTVCTYDNPTTMRRECWQDGKLIVSYSFTVLSPFAKTSIPAEHYFFGANIGDWNAGQLVGDIEAMKPLEVKQVIVMRKDLKMRRGKECAQASHSAMAWLTKRIVNPDFDYETSLSTEEKIWLEQSFTKICLIVNSEDELLDIYNKCLDAGLSVHLITDNGATEFHGVKTNTCLAIGPHYSSKIDPITKDLKLY